MKETLSSRVARIISGGAHAIVGAVENAMPEAILDEAVREIDGAIDEIRAELGRQIAKKHLANSRLMEENARHEKLTEQIEIAIGESREDLAESAVAQQLDIEAQIPILESAIAEAAGSEKELEGYIKALQGKKHQMQDEVRRFVASRNHSSVSSTEASGSSNADNKAEKAVSAFDRVMEKTSGLPASARMADRASAANLAELEDLARKNRIRERIAAVKSQASVSKSENGDK